MKENQIKEFKKFRIKFLKRKKIKKKKKKYKLFGKHEINWFNSLSSARLPSKKHKYCK